MAYDEVLAGRIRQLVAGAPGLSEKRMFGGYAFLIDGHLAVSASSRGGLLLRVDPAHTDELVDDLHVRRFEMAGRAMDGWLGIDAEAVESEDDLRAWISRGISYARSLPAT
ncbi:TfoX/Sxy family protein [Nocardioides sp.]|uniref:TfoX/Sxy family protein n=1 Tax=Nocardioides sp. TaxID=35761 RepID=UPI003D127889